MKSRIAFFIIMAVLMTGTGRLLNEFSWPKAALYGVLVSLITVVGIHYFDKWAAKRVRKSKP